jgi:hypothetical protein
MNMFALPHANAAFTGSGELADVAAPICGKETPERERARRAQITAALEEQSAIQSGSA